MAGSNHKDSQQATRPNFYSDFTSLHDPLEQKTEQREELNPEESSLYALSLNEGWRILNEYILQLEKELDEIPTKLLNEHASFEEIGQKTAVGAVTKAYLERVRARVMDAREAVERAENDG